MKLYLCYAIFWSIVLSGCMTQNKFNKAADKHPDWLALECAETFPVTERLLPGKTDTLIQTNSRTDTVTIYVEKDGKPYPVKVACPSCNSTVRTLYKTDTLVREDSAKIYLANDRYVQESNAHDKTREELAETVREKETRTKQRNWLFAIVLVGLGYIGLRVFRVF